MHHGSESNSQNILVRKLCKEMANFEKKDEETIAQMMSRMEKLITQHNNNDVIFDHRSKCEGMKQALKQKH